MIRRRACLVWLALALACCGVSAQAAGTRGLVGKKAPEFRMQGVYQESYTLEMFKGHILVMQFGASW